MLYKIGGIVSYHDSKKQFNEQYLSPYLRKSEKVTTEEQVTTWLPVKEFKLFKGFKVFQNTLNPLNNLNHKQFELFLF